MRKNEKGYTLIELMTVAAILSILATTAVSRMNAGTLRARRVEAVGVLVAGVAMQKSYFAAENEFAPTFDLLGFAIDGGAHVSSTQLQAKTYTFQITPSAGGYLLTATGNADADAWPDAEVKDGRLVERPKGGAGTAQSGPDPSPLAPLPHGEKGTRAAVP